MIRSEINSRLREFARTLSPTSSDQDLVGKIYESINRLLGTNNCIQIGSYPRYTAIRPIHDLDVLYVLGAWTENDHSPDEALDTLYRSVLSDYKNPTNFSVKVSQQTHSVTLEFHNGNDLRFSVDVVPAYTFSTNDFGDPTYRVPEVLKIHDHKKRHQAQWDPSSDSSWIQSDPRGYISVASEVGVNNDFRKTVKIVKHWKNCLKDADASLKLRSFHLEQVVTLMFQEDELMDLADALFNFFINLPDTIAEANQIPDRANANKYVDDYIVNLSQAQKEKIVHARDNVLMALESIDSIASIEQIFKPNFKKRNPDEQYMFDHRIATHIDHTNPSRLSIHFDEAPPNRAERRAARKSHQPIGNKLYFKIVAGFDDAMRYFWKVKNSDLLHVNKRRGEITEGQTKNNPESTAWPGSHYVECYAVNEDDICVDIARVDVPIGDENA